MKRLVLLLSFALLFCFAPASTAQATNNTDILCSGDTNDFYFEDFTADYYLLKEADGISRLRVVEHLTAVFPECDQNRGIVREIPFTNQDGTNVTLPTPTITATRNGEPESIANLEIEDNVYLVYLGKAGEYVHGRQEYVLEYEFEKVITDFDGFQELYWDTNGTGWRQPFNSLTANLHIDQSLLPKLINQDTSCYVGKYGYSSQERCYYTETDDGYSFAAFNLTAGENLTFAVRFDADTFTVPKAPRNWIMVIIFSLELIVIFLAFRRFYHKTWAATAAKRHWYKYAPVAPQYAPLKGYTVGEMTTVYVGKSKNPKVATLLELAIHHKVELRQEQKGISKKWYIKILNLSGIKADEKAVLELLAGSSSISEGQEFQVKRHSYSATLQQIDKSYFKSTIKELKAQGKLESSTKNITDLAFGNSTLDFITIVISLILVYTIAPVFVGLLMLAVLISNYLISGVNFVSTVNLVGGVPLIISAFAVATIAIFVGFALSKNCKRFKGRTMEGLELSIYMAGLKEYIKLAEADRIEFLQSVKGADVSPKGIVKLHEKLLPYAVLFGVEKSWMAELAHYYETIPETNPDWVVGAAYLSASDFSSAMRSVSASTSSISASSTGGSSSGSSGGGGGGFSGGGGGGGGGGGW